MRTRAALVATAAALPALFAAALPRHASNLHAQTPPTSQPAPAGEDRMDRFERRLDELEQRHRQELEARDEEIERLKARLGEGDVPPLARPDGHSDHDHAHDNVETTKKEVAADAEHRHTHDDEHAHGAAGGESKLDVTAAADFVATYSPDRDNDAYNRLDVREFHLDLRAQMHRSADGVAILSFERDVENPIFFESGDGGDEGEGGPETSVDVEEAYVFLHDFGVPGLTAKAGRFHVRFGRQNLLHLHELPTTDPPFVNQAFLAPESLTDAGVSVAYVIPRRFVANQHVELVGELLAGEGANSESPTLGGDLSVDSPAFNVHVLWNTNVAENVNFEVGGSWLRGHRGEDNADDVNIFGVDATLVRRDPGNEFRNTMLQAEAMYAVVDQPGGDTEEALGAYLLGQQQFDRAWYAGLRLDWTQNPNAGDEEAWGVTPYVTWHWTEFLRFRVSYQHRGGDRPEEDVVMLQMTWLFGDHPAHPYWEVTH